MEFKHAYVNETEYDIIQVFDWGEYRKVPETKPSYIEWVKANTPEKISGNRFVTIIDGEPVIDSDKDSIIESDKWVSLRKQAENDLKDSEWMIISDSTLTTEQKTAAKAYRKSLMDLKKNYKTADEAIAAFESIEKPDYKLW